MVAAVIVLYLPDPSLLNRLIESVIDQAERIFIVDNSPDSSAYAKLFPKKHREHISYIPLGDNKGIATAQNIGIRESLNAGYSHVLLLDQDSALPAEMVKKLLAAEARLIHQGKKVAAVGPLFIDEKTGSFSRAIRHSYLKVHRIKVDQTIATPAETDYIIASGSLIRNVVFDEVGLMREELFIDWVDIEWGLRAKSLGYKSYIVQSVRMMHSIGDDFVRFLGKEINLHTDLRHYYLIRNATFLLRVRHMGKEWRLVTLLKIPQYVLFYSFHSKNMITSMKLLLSAIHDGACGKLERID